MTTQRTYRLRIKNKIVNATIIVGVLIWFGVTKLSLTWDVQPFDSKAVLLPNNNNRVAQAFFSCKDNIRGLISELIRNERSRIRCAMYMLTDSCIAQELMLAHDRGVAIEIISQEHTGPPWNKKGALWNVYKHGVPVFGYTFTGKENGMFPPIMHHKFFVFDQTLDGRALVVTGSFNCTNAAQDKNLENIVVLDDAHVITAYAQHFDELRAQTHELYRTKKKKKPKKNANPGLCPV